MERFLTKKERQQKVEKATGLLRVENARKELWSAKYDTMSAKQLQAALAEV